MSVSLPSLPRRPIRPPTRSVGLLIGLAAATPGLASPLPLRPWHLLLLSAFAVSLAYQHRVGNLFFRRLLPLDLSVLMFTLITLLVEATNADYLNFSPNYASVVNPLFWLLAYWSARYVLSSTSDAYRLLLWFTFPVIPSVVIGFAQVLGIEAAQQLTVQLSAQGDGFARRVEDGLFIRATGFVQHWTAFGSYLCTVVAAATALLILARVHRAGREFYAWLALCAAVLGVLTTLTVSAIVTSAAIFLIGSKAARSLKKSIFFILITVTVGAASLGFVIQDRIEEQFLNRREASSDGTSSWIPSTLLYRYSIWTSETVPAIKDRPWIGWGTGVYDVTTGNPTPKRIYPYQLSWVSAESQWLALLVSFGILGLSAFVIILIAIVFAILRGVRKGASWVSIPTAALFFMMIIAALTAPVFTNYGLPIGMWTLLGVIAAFSYPGQQRKLR